MNVLSAERREWILECLRAGIGVRETARRCHVALETARSYGHRAGVVPSRSDGLRAHHAHRRQRPRTCQRDGCSGRLQRRGAWYMDVGGYEENCIVPVEMPPQIRTHCPACDDWSIWIGDDEIDGGPGIGLETTWT